MRDVRVGVTVSGRVKGVFFRHYTKKMAEELELKGWVRNNLGNVVEAVFEGPENRVKEMLLWLQEGPPRAQVTQINVEYEDPRNDFEGFTIEH